MTREFVVHFEPYDGGSRVDAEVFVKALSSLVEGFRSMANALAPAIAQRTSWSKVLVKEALTLAFSSVDKGSLDLRVVHGAAPAGAMLETERIAGIGWKAMTAAINGAAQGKTVISDVPLAAAENFARAARVARDANVRVSLCSRRVARASASPSAWRTNLDLTGIEPALSGYVQRRATAERSQTQLVGQIVALTYHPPAFSLLTGKGKFAVSMPAGLRQKAREMWGEEVVVLVDANITAEGDVRDPKAVDIAPAAVASVEDDAEDGFGLFKGTWDTPESTEYFESLRGRGH